MAYNDRTTLKPQYGVGQVNTFATQVYGWMTVGLALTALVAWFIFKSGLYTAVLPFWWVTALGTFAIALAISSSLNKISFSGLATLFLAYSALEGVFFGSILPGFAAAFGGQIIW